MANEIKIIIGGDASGLTNAANAVNDRLGILKKRLEGLQKAAASTSDFSKLNQALDLIKKTQSEINKIEKVGVPLQGAVKGADQATNALTNLSRVAQDAPFGFIGIQNNLNPLLESFGRLKQETGSAGAALKALGASLAGPAGVGLALGVVTGLVTVAIQKYGSLGNAMDALFNSTNAAEQAQRDIAKAFADGEGKAAGEIANINALLKVAKDETLSRQARSEAINKLNKQYDDYLPKLTQENIDTKAVTESVDKLTKSLVRQAQIKGLQDLISKETAKQAEIFAQSMGDNASAWDNIVASIKSLGPGGNFFNQQTIEGAKRAGINFKESQERIEAFQKVLDALTKDEAIAGTLFHEDPKDVDLLKQRISALKEIQSLQGLTSAQQVELAQLEIKLINRDGVKLGFNPSEIKAQSEAILEKAFPVRTFEYDTIVTTRVNKLEAVAVKDAKALTEDFKTDIAKAIGIDGTLEIAAPKFRFTNIKSEADIARAQMAAIIQALAQGIQDAAIQGSEIVGTAFAEILSGEGVGSALAKAAKGLLGVVGGILQEVGKQIIIASNLVAALKKAIGKLLGPGGEVIGIAVGAALIATGAILKNIQFDVPKLAKGGIATSPTLGIFGEAGKEAIIPLDRLPDIIGKLSMNSNANVTLAPSFRISLTDLELGLERVRKSRGRLG
jgi:hypothetical protein